MAAVTDTITITDDNFESEIESHEGLALVDFWAEWCAPCRIVAPVMEELAGRYAGEVKVGKLDVDSNPGTAQRFNVRSIPTVLFFRGGEVVETVVGALPKGEYEARIERHRDEARIERHR